MGWDVTITPPDGFPDVNESIVGFSNCPGNMYRAVIDLHNKQLRQMSTEEAIDSLKKVIFEIDKGNEGLFSDQYCYEGDQQWSSGRETTEDWEKYKNHLALMPFKTYREYCGWESRSRIREQAVRYLLYYMAGYKIEFEW